MNVHDMMNPMLGALAQGLASGIERREAERFAQEVAEAIHAAECNAQAWENYAKKLEAQNKALTKENSDLKSALSFEEEYQKELSEKLRAVKRAHYANSSEKAAMKASLDWLETQLADLQDPEKLKTMDIGKRQEVFRQAWEEFRSSTTPNDLANIAYRIENVRSPSGYPSKDIF